MAETDKAVEAAWDVLLDASSHIDWDGPSRNDVSAALAAAYPELVAEIERLRTALRIIAGEEQCIDNLMSNADVARAALKDNRHGE